MRAARVSVSSAQLTVLWARPSDDADARLDPDVMESQRPRHRVDALVMVVDNRRFPAHPALN
jgi:hypothetical protein